MEQQATNLLSTLRRPSAPSEAKLNLLNTIKSDIKHYRVPEAAQATIFECLKIAITQQTSSTLVPSAFSTLGHLIKRLKIQDVSGSAITLHAPKLLPALQERLGDSRENHRVAASQAFSDLWPLCAQDVEKTIREGVLTGANARAKEMGMQWVEKMGQEQGLHFKSFVPPMVACLEDSDGSVRETAKSALVSLFRNASDPAKTDLKKQMNAHSVRQSIMTQVLSQVGSSSNVDADFKASTQSAPALDHSARFAESITGETAMPPAEETVPMDPIYVQSQRELDDIFRDMLPHFEGKESEQNWTPRDKDVLKLRRLIKGNAPSEFHGPFVAGIKNLMEGILKVANSLRTTMSTNGCQLVQELVRTLGSELDSTVEILLQSFIKMCAATKPIAHRNGNTTVETIFQHASYNTRIMQHVWYACQDKNVQPRMYAPTWLKTILKRQAAHKAHFESSGGLELAEKCIKKGLADANPNVKECMRSTYWTFARTWPDKADAIMGALDTKQRDQLEKHADNPHASMASSHSSIGTVSYGPRQVAGSAASRSALKETIAAQKKAKMAARGLPERPSSAMATLSPQKTKSANNSKERAPSSLSQVTSARVVSNGSTTSSSRTTETAPSANSSTVKGSLMSGPIRRPRRPEMARPATADPYARQRLLRPETPSDKSPVNSPPKGTASKTSVSTTNAVRQRTDRTQSPAASPVRPKDSAEKAHGTRLSNKDTSSLRPEDMSSIREDDFTMVLPSSRPLSNSAIGAPSARWRPNIEKTMSVDSGIPMITEDDGFTIVMPTTYVPQRERTPVIRQSPSLQPKREAAAEAKRHDSAASKPHSPLPDPFSLSEPSRSSSRLPTPSRSTNNGLRDLEEINIYEDPFTVVEGPAAPATPSRSQTAVLGELPLNENIVGAAASPSPRSSAHNSPAQNGTTAQDKAELQRSRRLLASGIERVHAKSLDAHGFRRMQDIVKSNTQLFDDGKVRFAELLDALVEYLEAPEAAFRTTPVKAQGLKSQALVTIRALASADRTPAQESCPTALKSLLRVRGSIEATNHLATDIEKTAFEIAETAPTTDTLSTVLDFLASPPPSPAQPKAIALALTVLAQLAPNSPSPTKQLAATAARFLDHHDVGVRQADYELCLRLYESAAEKGDFWAALMSERKIDEGSVNLITYYVARRSTGAGAVTA
ncbi:suppressor of tub2 mutation [Elasticomyces elasticus]|nr:suppressor of tub2 mutation [Elasticomyces elasticus]